MLQTAYRFRALQVLVQVKSQAVPPAPSAVRTVDFLRQEIFKFLHCFLWQQYKERLINARSTGSDYGWQPTGLVRSVHNEGQCSHCSPAWSLNCLGICTWPQVPAWWLVLSPRRSGNSHKSPPSPLWQLKAPEDPGSQAVAGTGKHCHWEPSRPKSHWDLRHAVK